MGHGGPDWGTTGPTGTIFTIEDLGELAARLGSIDTYDRRGNIVAFEDFQGTLSHLTLSTSRDGGTIEQSSLYSRTPDFSLKMQTGDTAGDKANLWMHTVVLHPSKLGFEFSFSTEHTGFLLGFAIYMYSPSGFYLSNLEWIPETESMKYWDEDFNPVDLPGTFSYYSAEERFSTAKLVIDLPHARYERLLWNDMEVDMSHLSLKHSLVAAAPYAQCRIYVENTTLVDRRIYVDDLIFTQNEP